MSLKIVISNQRGGVSKTTTTTTLAREFTDRGKRVLVIDTDPQGSISSILNLKPEYGLYNFVIERLIFDDCIVRINENLHVMCSNRETTKVETLLMGNVAREPVHRWQILHLSERVVHRSGLGREEAKDAHHLQARSGWQAIQVWRGATETRRTGRLSASRTMHPATPKSLSEHS